MRLFGFIAALLGVLAPAQTQGPIEPRRRPNTREEAPLGASNIRVDTTLVLVPVTVSDPLNRPVIGLEKENFRVFEDKVEQRILNFSSDDEPTAVGLVFDTSGSMGEKLKRSRAAAAEFFRTANPEDEYFLVQFDSAPKLVVPLTRDTSKIESELMFSRSKGSTALVDAIYMALHELRKSRKNKKALLVISDGGDNNSRYTVSELNHLLRETDALIYGIGVFGGGSTAEERTGPWLLDRIANESGGRLFIAESRELPDIAKKIGIDLRNRYVLAYAPSNGERDGRYRHIRVTVLTPRGMPKLSPHWRTGYFAPAR
jgi:Ca-activated chloride channel homolog